MNMTAKLCITGSSSLITPRVVAVQAASSSESQAFLARLADFWRASGLRVAGAVQETAEIEPGARPVKVLRDLTSGERHPILQSLGPGSSACCVDPRGMAAACAGIERAARQGCDVVIISKFGKLEIDRSGLLDAFAAAMEMDTPVVTSVSASAMSAWEQFAGPLAAFVPPDLAAIENWRKTHKLDSNLLLPISAR
jgi:nucleoside-triphosphatase THEP1